MLPTRAGGPGNRRTWALSFLRSSSLRFQRFPRGLSGSRQIARERCCCTPNMPYGAPGNCRQRFLDRAGKPLDERFNESRGLTEILCGFAAGFCAELGNNELMDRITLGDRHAHQDNSMGTQYRHFLRVPQEVAKMR